MNEKIPEKIPYEGSSAEAEEPGAIRQVDQTITHSESLLRESLLLLRNLHDRLIGPRPVGGATGADKPKPDGEIESLDGEIESLKAVARRNVDCSEQLLGELHELARSL